MVTVAAPFIDMAVVAETKNPEVAEAKTNALKSISESRVLTLTDLHGNGCRLKLM